MYHVYQFMVTVLICDRSDFAVFIFHRFISMHIEMDEINFLHMHKTVVIEVISKFNISKALSMMKVNSIVSRSRTEVPPVDDANTEPVPEQSPSTVGIAAKSKCQGVASKSSKGKAKPKSAPVVQPSVEIPEEYGLYRTVATQTMENIGSEEEKRFEQFDMMSMRQKYLVTVIKQEDFDD